MGPKLSRRNNLRIVCAGSIPAGGANFMSEKITLPTIHLNGTGEKTLFGGYLAARSALIAAQEALENVEFNSRDYHPVDGAWDRALEERKQWLTQLRAMQEGCLAICAHIQLHGLRGNLPATTPYGGCP